MQPLISIKNLVYTYPKSHDPALKNINLTIDAGDYVAIVGTSGSGKSTLLSILGLINKPTGGEFYLLGSSVAKLTNKSIALLKNREIGFVFQNFNLLSHLKVYDNVSLPLSYNPDVPRKAYREKVMQALELVDMGEYSARYPDQLSGGQQQRVAIARALVNSPSLILADEPTGNLDSKTSEQVYSVIDTLHKMGKTVCLITHDKHYAQKALKRFTITDGTLCDEG